MSTYLHTDVPFVSQIPHLCYKPTCYFEDGCQERSLTGSALRLEQASSSRWFTADSECKLLLLPQNFCFCSLKEYFIILIRFFSFPPYQLCISFLFFCTKGQLRRYTLYYHRTLEVTGDKPRSSEDYAMKLKRQKEHAVTGIKIKHMRDTLSFTGCQP